MTRTLRLFAVLLSAGAVTFASKTTERLLHADGRSASNAWTVVRAAHAQEAMIDPRTALARLFDSEPVEADWFTTDFVTAVPPSQVDGIIDALTADFGAFVDAQVTGTDGTVRLDRALVPVSVTLDGTGRIAGLLFRPPEPLGADAEEIAERIAAVAVGDVAVLATERSRGSVAEQATPEAEEWHDRVAAGADEPMAVGSAFKLVVLRAYEDAIAAGAVRREEVIELTEADRSLPSGVLHTLRPGTPVTLETLAGLMIRHSDNTATDALMRVLGRDAMEAISRRNRPFLRTAELFKLIASGADERRAAFAAGDEGERRAVLAELAGAPLPNVADLRPRATWADAEWFLTGRELCDLLLSLRAAPALNGLPEPLVAPLLERDGWSWVGFKGGSEFGVLNLSAAGRTPDGRNVCAVMTANGTDAQPDDRLALLFGALLRGLAERTR